MLLIDENGLDFNIPRPKQTVTIEGWVARSKRGYLSLFDCLPKRCCGVWLKTRGYYQSTIPTDSFPDLKWTDEPLAVTIQITEK